MALGTYDYANLPIDESAIESYATPSFDKKAVADLQKFAATATGKTYKNTPIVTAVAYLDGGCATPRLIARLRPSYEAAGRDDQTSNLLVTYQHSADLGLLISDLKQQDAGQLIPAETTACPADLPIIKTDVSDLSNINAADSAADEATISRIAAPSAQAVLLGTVRSALSASPGLVLSTNVAEIGLSGGDCTSPQVLVLGTATFHDTAAQTPQTTTYAATVSFTRTAGRLTVSKLTLVK